MCTDCKPLSSLNRQELSSSFMSVDMPLEAQIEAQTETQTETPLDAQMPEVDEALAARDIFFMRLAMAEAEKARAIGEVPCGCVIVKDDAVIASAWNQVESRKDAMAHAEVLALKQAQEIFGDWRLEHCTIYVTKEPCPMCAGAMVHCRPARVVFGIRDSRGGACGGWINLLDSTPHLNHCADIRGGVLEEECLAQFQSFFRLARAEAKRRKLAAREEAKTLEARSAAEAHEVSSGLATSEEAATLAPVDLRSPSSKGKASV